LHHVYFDQTAPKYDRIIFVEPSGTTCADYSAGLIDHITMDRNTQLQIHVREAGPSGGNCSWSRPLGLGNADCVYVEDSLFVHSAPPGGSYNTSRPATDSDAGGRMCFRHNTIKCNYTEMHDAIIGSMRSTRRWETYDNHWVETCGWDQYGLIGIRGGTGVMFNNVTESFTSSTAEESIVAVYRPDQADSDPWDELCSNTSGKMCVLPGHVPAGCTDDSQCGGITGSCVTMDGPSSSPTGYPCRDQFGLTGNKVQVSRPALSWNNLKTNASAVNPNTKFNFNPFRNPSYTVANRDFCEDDTTMPASCNGVTTNYVPYTYPHPLQGGNHAPRPPTP
jgi:hypothetical protein